MTNIKVYTLCDGEGKQIEVPLQETATGFFTVFSTCPHCKTGNPRWLRIVVDEEKVNL